MYRMISCARLFNKWDISKWDVSSVKDMSSMFLGATSFNRDISKWDVSSVVTMTAMFRWTTCFNGGISKVGRVKRGKHGLHVLGCEVV
jgi:surface protein